MKRIAVPLALAVLVSLGLSGCAIGYNRVLFMTKSNIGLDIDTKPPTAEITISRKEGTIGPTFEGGAKPPVLASFRSAFRGIFGVTADVSSTFAGGDAADTMTKLFGSADEGPAEDSTRCLSTKPTPSVMNTSINLPGPGDVKPFVFGTDTSIGLKVAWSGTTAEFPDSVKFGYNRKEFALAPVFATPATGTAGKIGTIDAPKKVVVFADGRAYQINPETLLVVDEQVVGFDALRPGIRLSIFGGAAVKATKNGYVWRPEPGSQCAQGQYRINIPSFMATIDHESSAKSPRDTGLKHLQYFATGQSATNLALHKEIREVMLSRLDPDSAAKMLKTFSDEQDQQITTVESIQAAFEEADDATKQTILKKAVDLKLVDADTTPGDFKKRLARAVNGNESTTTKSLKDLEALAKGG